MKKLKLDLDALEVETYEPRTEAAPRGTVEANGYPYTDEAIGSCTCGRTYTAPITCENTCFMIETCEPGVCW